MGFDSPLVWLSLGVAVSAAAGIWGHYAGERRRWVSYVFRPLAGLAILTIALTAPGSADPRYFWGIAVGLFLALVGDVFLMLPKDLFFAGLASFAGAHVCFLVAFTSGVDFAARALPFVLLGAIGAGVVAFIWPGVGKRLRIPVVVYVALLVSMSAQAWTRHLALDGGATLAAAAGATLFLASDAMLSIDLFRKPFAAARLVVLSTFYAADWLIALSVHG